MNFVKNAAAGAVLGGSLLFTAGLGMAQAQPAETPDGLVSLSIGDVTLLESATADKAAAAAAAICGAVPADVSALVAQVDSEGAEQTVWFGPSRGDLVVDPERGRRRGDACCADAGSGRDTGAGRGGRARG
ncbi:hypothetical protein [Mycolicibacterium vanbaalenii]|uniref:hypothetical protein n=1 Tax=Mycolicibacterium vanbaalenii TaxID=110539 RepID=UPI0021F34681|nr:hypothetical protein [Mycolicibacterium vanbaalenii]